jgi:hypothetical protein
VDTFLQVNWRIPSEIGRRCTHFHTSEITYLLHRNFLNFNRQVLFQDKENRDKGKRKPNKSGEGEEI